MTAFSLAPAPVALVLAMSLGLPLAAGAQSADGAPSVKRAQTLKTPPRDSKVLGSVQRGTDAAGRGIDRAGKATRRGVDQTSERASRPVRNVGESLGRKLPGGTRDPAPPPVGPQSNALSPS